MAAPEKAVNGFGVRGIWSLDKTVFTEDDFVAAGFDAVAPTAFEESDARRSEISQAALEVRPRSLYSAVLSRSCLRSR